MFQKANLSSHNCKTGRYLLMDRTYEGNKMTTIALKQRVIFDISSKKNTLTIFL